MKKTETGARTKDAIYPPKDVNDVILQLIPYPDCKLYNCHGKGWVGIRANADGSKTVITCRCASYGETDYVRAMKRLDKIELQINALTHRHGENLKAVATELAMIRGESFTGRFRRFRAFFQRPRTMVIPTLTKETANAASE